VGEGEEQSKRKVGTKSETMTRLLARSSKEGWRFTREGRLGKSERRKKEGRNFSSEASTGGN